MMLTKKEPETFTYEEAAAYIEEIPKFTKKHTLEHTKMFLKRLGNPAADRKIVHVAGTNGKGSVCAYLQAILMAEGKRTGFFTSPHLVSVNERIRVDNIQIDNETFLKMFRKVLKIVRQMVEDGIEHPSYFEFLFGMGMTAFAETDVEYIILETGLGGRLDATNAIDNPALAIITSISLDHTAILGDTIEKIAGEKAGIIKPGVPVFFDGSSKKAAEVIKAKASELGVSCREVTNHRQHPRGLRRIQHEWHTLLPTQRRDALYRQSEAKHVGHVCADHRVRRTRQRSGELPYHLLPIKQRPIRYRDLHTRYGVQRPGNSVVLIPRNDHPSAGLHQRMHGNVQPMCSAGGEHHSRRISHAKQLCCQCAALQVCFLRRPRGRITPPPRRG